jgi:hypothetical protein
MFQWRIEHDRTSPPWTAPSHPLCEHMLTRFTDTNSRRSPHLSVLPKCLMRKHAYIQCAEVIEHFFQARTQGFETRVAPHARSLNKQPPS